MFHNKGCEFTGDCPFHQVYGQKKSNVWQAVLNMYCHGTSKTLCHNYEQQQATGRFSDTHVMPTGRPVTLAFKMLS
jgi:hypothetical protein